MCLMCNVILTVLRRIVVVSPQNTCCEVPMSLLAPLTQTLMLKSAHNLSEVDVKKHAWIVLYPPSFSVT